MQCDGIRRDARQCTRRAVYLYLRRAGGPNSKHWKTVKGYCGQHHSGAGPTRMLRPFPWDFDRIVKVDVRGFVDDVVFDRAENPSGTFIVDGPRGFESHGTLQAMNRFVADEFGGDSESRAFVDGPFGPGSGGTR